MVRAAHLAHLVRRFFGSLWPGGPSADDERWARARLLPGERELWDRMSGPDRRHALGVARRTAAELGEEADRPVLAAALLHDVGKIEAAIGPIRRALATTLALALGHDRVRQRRGRFGLYLRHDAIGADLLRSRGSDDLTVRWAAQHHLHPDRWTIPTHVGMALKAADDD